MAAKKLFTQIFTYFSKPLRLLYSLIIYEIVNFSFFTLLFATSFISEKCSYIRDCSCTCTYSKMVSFDCRFKSQVTLQLKLNCNFKVILYLVIF